MLNSVAYPPLVRFPPTACTFAPDSATLRKTGDVSPGHFAAQAFDTSQLPAEAAPVPYQRRDLYKITLYTGGSTLIHYAGHKLVVDRPSLFFFNPLLPYGCQDHQQLTGYYCQFTEQFLYGLSPLAVLQESPLFRMGAVPLFPLDQVQVQQVQGVFEQLLAEQAMAGPYRDDFLRTQVQLLTLTALRWHTERGPSPVVDGGSQLAAQFLRLLAQQFPVASVSQPLALRTATDFAGQLGTSVNHLNRAVRAATGRTTSAHLAERIAHEARRLLRYSDWPLVLIADSLGFASATYFNSFFRQHTGLTPNGYRKQPVS